MKNKLWIIAGVAIAVFCLIGQKDCRGAADFDPIAWRNGDYRTRGMMCRSLASSNILVGKNRDEVVQLLGPPDEDWPEFTKYAIDLGGIWERWMMRYNFMIEFDKESGTVTTAHLIDA